MCVEEDIWPYQPTGSGSASAVAELFTVSAWITLKIELIQESYVTVNLKLESQSRPVASFQGLRHSAVISDSTGLGLGVDAAKRLRPTKL